MRGAVAFYASVAVGGIGTFILVTVLKSIVTWIRMIQDPEIVRLFAGAGIIALVAIFVCALGAPRR